VKNTVPVPKGITVYSWSLKDPGTKIQVTLRNLFLQYERGYTNVYSHRTKESHQLMHLSNILVGKAGR
jgi:hypothetical protein